MESRSKKSRFKELTVKLTKDELVRRMKSIALELSNVDQEEHSDDLDALAASLVTPFIMGHADKDVRAIAAGCLADILRVYAPDPPYNEDQLKDIFDLIVKQLKYLENPDNQMYKRAFYVLESLALVKSFNICFDLDAQEIITALFKLFFSIVSSKHSVKVRNFMIDIMAPVIQESESLPQDVLEIILTHCLPTEKKSNEVAYQMASTLIDKTSSALEPYVQLFFNNALVLEKGVESKLVDHLYDLIYELYNINRSVLLSVLPQLEFKLKRNEEDDRLEVVKLLGRMFADASFELAQQNRPLWLCFLGRYHDISVDVRVEFIERAKSILISNPALTADIVDHFLERYLDPDERVRQKVVVSVCEAASESMETLPKKLFDPLQERMRDKKWMVRKEALTCVAKLYNRLLSGENAKDAVANIAWAPNRLVHAYYQNTIEDKLCVERIVHGCLVPVTLQDNERMKRLLNLYAGFDEHSLCAFDGMIKYRGAINLQFQSLLDAWTHDDPEEKEKLISSRVIMLAMSLPEPFKAQVHLKKFVSMFSDKELYKSLMVSANIENGCDKVMKAMGDVVKKLTTKNPIIDTVKALLDRGCNMLIDAKSLVKLLKHINEAIDGLDIDEEEVEIPKGGKQSTLSLKARRGLLLIKCLAAVMPTVFKSKECFQQLLLMIKHKESLVVESSLKVLSCVADGLVNLDKGVTSCFQPVLSKLATEGSAKEAKYAIRSMFNMLRDPTNAVDRIFNCLVDNMAPDMPNLMTTLSSLGEIATLAPLIFEKRHKYVIREMIVKEIMVKDREKTSDSQESDDEWCDPKFISSETTIKIRCIKVMVKWLVGIQSGLQNAAMPVCRLLHTMLKNDGDLNSTGQISAQNRSHLRLAAASAFIKIAQIPNCWDVITLEQYRQVALTIQDSCYEVRQKFSLKLHKALDILKLPLDYLAIFALSAVDPAKDRKQQVKQMIAKNAQTRREYIKQHSLAQAKPFAILPEYVLPSLIHLLAHHPDFDNKKIDSLRETKECLWFFLETIMGPKAENHAFLKKLAENIKQTKDAEDPENETLNEKIYTVCDLTVWLIMNKTHAVALKDFPGNPVLPKKLFAANPDKKAVNTKIYLPKEFGGLTAPKRKIAPLDIQIQPPLKFQTSTPAVHNGRPTTTEVAPDETATTPIRSKADAVLAVQGSDNSTEMVDMSSPADESDITFSPTVKKTVHYADLDHRPPVVSPVTEEPEVAMEDTQQDVVEEEKMDKEETKAKQPVKSRKRPAGKEEESDKEGPQKGSKVSRKEAQTSKGKVTPKQRAAAAKTQKAKDTSPTNASNRTAKSPAKQTKMTSFAKKTTEKSKVTPPKKKQIQETSPAKKQAKSPAKNTVKDADKPAAKSPRGRPPVKSPGKASTAAAKSSPGKSPRGKTDSSKKGKTEKQPTKESVKRKLDTDSSTSEREAKQSVKVSKSEPVVIGSKRSSPKSAAAEKASPAKKFQEDELDSSPTKEDVSSDTPTKSTATKSKTTKSAKSAPTKSASKPSPKKSPTKSSPTKSPSTKTSPTKVTPTKASPRKSTPSKSSPAKQDQSKLVVKRSRAKRR